MLTPVREGGVFTREGGVFTREGGVFTREGMSFAANDMPSLVNDMPSLANTPPSLVNDMPSLDVNGMPSSSVPLCGSYFMRLMWGVPLGGKPSARQRPPGPRVSMGRGRASLVPRRCFAASPCSLECLACFAALDPGCQTARYACYACDMHAMRTRRAFLRRAGRVALRCFPSRPTPCCLSYGMQDMM